MTAEEIFQAYMNSSTPIPASVVKWVISHSEGMSQAFTTVLSRIRQNPPKPKKIPMGRNFSTVEYPLPSLIKSVQTAEQGTGLRIELLFPKHPVPNYESIMPNLNYKGLDKHLGVLSYPIVARNKRNGVTSQDASSAVSYARRVALATILNLVSSNDGGGNFGGSYQYRNGSSNYPQYPNNYRYGNNNRGRQYSYRNQGTSSPMGNNSSYSYRYQKQNNYPNNNGNYPNSNYPNNRGTGNFKQAEASSSTNTVTASRTSASPKLNQSSNSSARSTKPASKKTSKKPIKRLTPRQAQNLKDAMNKMYSTNKMSKQGILKIVKSASGMKSSQRFPSQFPADKYSSVMVTLKSFSRPPKKQTSTK